MSYRLSAIAKDLPATVPFVGPEAQERARGRPFKARIGANESVFGPSPKVIEAIRASAGDTWMYADPENHDLKEALAEFHGISPDNIVIGEGIDGLFGYTARLFVEQGARVATSLGAYPTFNYQVAGAGGAIATVPYRDDHEDPEALLALAKQIDARLIFIANPDNPMGTWRDAETITGMIDAVPDGAVLCLDEAYCDFAPSDALPPLDVSDQRVIRFRTFSKAYGLAGCRIAYAIGEAGLIKNFDKLRNHFGVNRIAQTAALAALADQDYLKHVVNQVTASRDRIAEIASANGLNSLPSATNFVAVDCGRDGAYATAVLKALIDLDVFVRMPGVEPLNRCIRISAGRKHDMELLEQALPDALAVAAKG